METGVRRNHTSTYKPKAALPISVRPTGSKTVDKVLQPLKADLVMTVTRVFDRSTVWSFLHLGMRKWIGKESCGDWVNFVCSTGR